MQELEVINTLLGGHRITINGFKKCVGDKTSLSVCEIGCGGGDNLKAIFRYASKRGILVNMIGIDLKQECIDYAKENCREIVNAQWICADYKQAQLPSDPDIIFSSLFCHHFSDEGLAEIFEWMNQHAKSGFFINDLQRHPLAFYSIKFLTSIFSRSYLVKNDAPLSVRRGFHQSELRKQVNTALQKDNSWKYEIHWQWAFRWLVTGIKK